MLHWQTNWKQWGTGACASMYLECIQILGQGDVLYMYIKITYTNHKVHFLQTASIHVTIFMYSNLLHLGQIKYFFSWLKYLGSDSPQATQEPW